MTPREELIAANAAIAAAAALLRPHLDLFDRYERERQSMESVGAILNPSLFMDPERRRVDAAMAPVYQAAARFSREHATATHAIVDALVARAVADADRDGAA